MIAAVIGVWLSAHVSGGCWLIKTLQGSAPTRGHWAVRSASGYDQPRVDLIQTTSPNGATALSFCAQGLVICILSATPWNPGQFAPSPALSRMRSKARSKPYIEIRRPEHGEPE